MQNVDIENLPIGTVIEASTSYTRSAKLSDIKGKIVKRTKTGYRVETERGKWFIAQPKYISKVY